MAPAREFSPTGRAHDQIGTYEQDGQTASQDALYATTNRVPMPHPVESQRVGDNGLLLLRILILSISYHTSTEMTCQNASPALCSADIFSVKGKRCPATVRFSTVGGQSGSHDCARDPREFADLVANNLLVFFLRKPAKFPHFIHTQKWHLSTYLTHDDDPMMFWDYACNNPESIHPMMILMGERGIPYGYRFMHGYSCHAPKFVNRQGDCVYAQIHVRRQQGTKFVTQKDSNIEIQSMTPKQAEDPWEKEKINVLDLTHTVGEITLNENAINYFVEIERAVFNPAHIAPCIKPSANPILQSRLFSQANTHRHPVVVEFQQLPVNAPRVAFKYGNFQRNGPMVFYNQGTQANYLSPIDPIRFKPQFIGQAITFLSEHSGTFGSRCLTSLRVSGLSAMAGKMISCRDKALIKRQITIFTTFRDVDDDIARQLEKATDISNLRFTCVLKGKTVTKNNGALALGPHKGLSA
ncbi:catalase-like domain-containing protein [Xylariaceae sp. FL0662B]|nr:catalase-like domain-containing protein [Xylariaceae sp. FL0662B]